MKKILSLLIALITILPIILCSCNVELLTPMRSAPKTEAESKQQIIIDRIPETGLNELEEIALQEAIESIGDYADSMAYRINQWHTELLRDDDPWDECFAFYTIEAVHLDCDDEICFDLYDVGIYYHYEDAFSGDFVDLGYSAQNKIVVTRIVCEKRDK